MAWSKLVDGKYVAQPPCAPGHPLGSKEGLRQLKAAFDKLRGPPLPRAVRAGPPMPRRRRPVWRPAVRHVYPSSTPRPRERGARMVAASGRDGTGARDDGGGGGGGDGGDGPPPPPRSRAPFAGRGAL